MKKGGYASKIPEPRQAVLLFSGGIDTTITAARMIEDFDFEIFPLYFRRSNKINIGEESSVEFFNDYYSKRYGDKFHKIEIFTIDAPPISILPDLREYRDTVKKVDNKLYGNVIHNGYPLRDNILISFGVQYATAMNYRFGKNIKTIFNGLVEWDNFPHGNLMSNRATTIMICESVLDWEWQVIPPNLDPAFSSKSFSKKDEVKWALDHSIPLENTVSCWYPSKDDNGKIISCGECVACIERNYLFNKMGCPEKTTFKIKNVRGFGECKNN